MGGLLQIPGLSQEQRALATLDALDVDLEDIARELHYRQQRKRARVVREMALAAKTGGERRVLRAADGSGGYQDMQIHPESYHYWGQRLGYECWDDPQFVREYLRDNPAARVRTINDRLTIVKPEIARAKAPARGRRRGRWGL